MATNLLRRTQYYINPPLVPAFLYKRSKLAWQRLMVWSYREYQERIKQTSKRGHLKELQVHSGSYTPMRVMAELPSFRSICVFLKQNPKLWDSFDRNEQKFLVKAFKLNGLLQRT